MAVIDWDGWRRRYREMSPEEHREFYARVYASHPDQMHYSEELAKQFCDGLRDHTNMVEVGGWRGELAHDILASNTKIATWTNYEICEQAANASVCKDVRYLAVAGTPDGDAPDNAALLMSHSVEHMLLEEFLRIVDAVKPYCIYLDAPIGDDIPNWNGYLGTHIIDAGWSLISEELERREYKPVMSHKSHRGYVRTWRCEL